MSSFWGKVLHNSLNDAKGLVDPRNYVKAGEFAVEHPIGFGKAVGNSYLDLARHPLRAAEHPLTTALALAPIGGGIGKLADVGAEAGASTLLRNSINSENLAKTIASNRSRLPGLSAVRNVKDVAGDAKTRFDALKYDPGDGIPRNPYAGSAPGATIDRGLLEKLHGELGHPNTTHRISYPTSDRGATAGFFDHKTQDASVFLHNFHLRPGAEDINAAQQDLVKSMLHEARHGYQKANWSRPKRLIDTYRQYDKRAVEKDANQFMDANAAKYEGLVKIDPNAPFIPKDRLPAPPMGTHPAFPTSFEDLYSIASEASRGRVPGLDEEALMKHVEGLVKAGHMDPNDAMMLEDKLFGDARYSPPGSPQELLRRGIGKARPKAVTSIPNPYKMKGTFDTGVRSGLRTKAYDGQNAQPFQPAFPR